MRIALISDLHGNQVALQAVLDQIGQQPVDRIFCLGDVATLGPAPREVIAMLRELACPVIMGNHDAFLLDPELIHTYTEAPVVVEAVDWCREQLSRADLEYLAGFEALREVPLEGEIKALLYHGTPRSHMENLLAFTPPTTLDRMLAGHRAAIMAGGHTHIQMLRQHRGTLIVNPGSVGLPFKEFAAGQPPQLMFHAEYATIEARGDSLQVNLKRVHLDHQELWKPARDCSNPFCIWLLTQYA